MPTKRGQQRKDGPSASSASAPQNPVEEVSQQISEAITQWDSTGQDVVRELLSSRLDGLRSTPLSSVVLSHALSQLLSSALDPQSLATLFSSLIDGFSDDVKEERTELLGEALVDVIEVMEEVKEDADDATEGEGLTDVDQATKQWRGGEKGLEVVKLLLVTSPLILPWSRSFNSAGIEASAPTHPQSPAQPSVACLFEPTSNAAQPRRPPALICQAEYDPLLQAIQVQPPPRIVRGILRPHRPPHRS